MFLREVYVIVALEDAKYKLLGMRANIKELGSALRIEELKAVAEELDKQTLDSDFWGNQENSSKVLQRIKQTKDTIEDYERLSARLEDAITLAEMAIEENDESYVEEVQSELDAIVKQRELRYSFRANTIRTTQSFPSTRAPEEPRRRTGRRCSTV